MAWSAPLYRLYERRLFNSLRPEGLPSHLGVILDGHRRFARSEGLSDYTTSYRSGMAKLAELLEWSAQLQLPAVTAWVLSTDNLQRPREELDPYFDVLIELLEDLPRVRRAASAARSGSSAAWSCFLIASRKRPRARGGQVELALVLALQPRPWLRRAGRDRRCLQVPCRQARS